MEVKLDYPLRNNEGALRRVGFEIEYIDYSLENSVDFLHKLFGGNIAQKNDHYYQIQETQYGSFSVERDLKLLQKLSEKSADNLENKKFNIEGVANNILTGLLKDVVPIEIVTPPLPYDKVDVAEKIIDGLKKTPANDTSKSIFTAFGLHINPEVADFEAHHILNYLKAYCLLNHWLRREIEIDVSRRLSPFIDEYPRGYIKLILSENYNPNLEALIQDYLVHNNTRNRSLDMLPLFKFLKGERIDKLLASESIKPRPTFHYRLPNTNFRNDEWSVRSEWERWLLVEKIANNPELIDLMSKQYLKILNDNIFFDEKRWISETECYLEKIKK